MPLQNDTLTIRGRTIQLLRGGAGAPVLYLHGLVADVHSLPPSGGFTAFHDALASHFSLCAPALPGYADSEGFDDLETIEDAVFFCLDIIDTLKLDKVHLVGASLGGWIATEFATRYSHRLDKLVLINPLGISTPQARIGNFFYRTGCKFTKWQKCSKEEGLREKSEEFPRRQSHDECSPFPCR